MAAIIQPRTDHHGQAPHATMRPSRPPRHLSAVALPVSSGSRRSAPVAVGLHADPAEPLLGAHTLAAMAASVLVALLLALGIGQGTFSALVPEPGSTPIEASQGREVVVQPGDSVWTIARSIQPEGDLRPLVHRIVQANGGSPLQPGQRLTVPA